MPVKYDSLLPRWIRWWLIVSSIICSIDVSFTMLRPITLRDGPLYSFYYLWNIYADIDVRYGSANDVVTHATGPLMILEIVLNVVALIMDTQHSRHTIVTAFFTTVLVFWKTIIYMALYVDIPPGNPSPFYPDVRLWKIIFCFWVANGIWIVFPFGIIVYLWPQLAFLPYSTTLPSSSE